MTNRRAKELIQEMDAGFDSLDAVEMSIEIEDEILSNSGAIDDNVASVLLHAMSKDGDLFSDLLPDMAKSARAAIEKWKADRAAGS